MNVRWALLLPGVILLVLGILWALQGAGLVGGSVMSGQMLWIWIGILVALVGAALTYRGVAGGGRPA